MYHNGRVFEFTTDLECTLKDYKANGGTVFMLYSSNNGMRLT